MSEVQSSKQAMASAIGRMMRPKSVAIIGASPTPGSLGAGVMANMVRFGFGGDIYLVNPNRAEIDGRPCLKSALDLPEGVDCAVLAVPRVAVLDAVRACAKRKVGGLVIFAGGFAEMDEEGKRLQDEIADIAHAHDMAIEGPNCLGYINYGDGVATTFGAAHPIETGERAAVSVVSQSGAMAVVARAALLAHDIALSFTISTGNEAVNGLEDFLEFVIEDGQTKIIGIVAEQIRNPRRFLAIARRAHEAGKLMVLLHPGRSAAARQAAQTHTGAMTGDHAVMRALVTRQDVLVVDTLEELIDVCEYAIRLPSLPQAGPAVITDSGAHKGLLFDNCGDLGLDLPALSPHTAERIGAIAPDLVLPTNPLDLTALALVDPQLYRKTMKPLLEDPAIGSVVVASILSTGPLARRKTQPVIDAVQELEPDKPVIFAMMGEDSEIPDDLVADVRNAGMPFVRSPDRVMRTLAAFSRHAQRPQGRSSTTAPASETLPAGIIPEYRAKPLLAGAGIAVPSGALAKTLDQAREVAARIGYPVALKAQAADLAHKSDAGGVALRIADEEQLVSAWDRMHADILAARPGLKLDGILVEEMSRPGTELIIGARNDPAWGPVLVVGLGGVLTEALHDVRVLPPDLDAPSIAAELRKLKGAVLLDEFRGAPARDVEAAAALAEKLGAFLLAHPEIKEIDINPVMVGAVGEGAVALDALFVVQ